MKSGNGKEIKHKDPLMKNEAVLSYRETFNLCPNAGYRRDIAVTVKTYEDLCLWQDLIAHWGYMKDGKWHKRNPLDLKGLLTCLEFKQREHEQRMEKRSNGHDQAAPVPTRNRAGFPQRSVGDLQEVSIKPPSQYFRND